MIERAALLELHAKLIEVPSVSHHEGAIADFVQARLERTGVRVWRVGDNVIASGSERPPKLLLNSHLDTVPPNEGWARDPFVAQREGGRVYGLGSNDTKGSVAAMVLAFEAAVALGLDEVAVMLVPEEETGGKGTETAWPYVRDELGWRPEGVLVGEPTEMQPAVSQSGLVVLELIARGEACHAANATANPLFTLARDLGRIEGLGGQPTVVTGSTARNQVPGLASAYVDFRTEPGVSHEELVGRICGETECEVRVVSTRLTPYACPADCALLTAIDQAIGGKRFHSRTMSDLVYFSGCNAVKIGPGVSARSHTADEYILEEEVVQGAAGYLAIIREFLR
ncbi:MAG: M20/M25/M40 family metallo-hydrolase [Fimbriimonadaceae bacterium]|nr:MAG: M20/M25/M40 family metallo-hydrolase [Fimbriimonadaceae bacterium]